MDARKNVIIEKSFKFAVRIVNLYKFMNLQKKEFILSKQLLRCGTSIGANVEEAHGGVSNKDFSNKISISYKEARETEYWLKLLFATNYIDKKMYESISNDCSELCKILYSIIKSTNKK